MPAGFMFPRISDESPIGEMGSDPRATGVSCAPQTFWHANPLMFISINGFSVK